jgi:multidrug efflux pump
MAFILGVIPLVTASGAGAAGRHSIGTGVLGGMIAATLLAVLFVPLYFKLLQRDQPAKPKG